VDNIALSTTLIFCLNRFKSHIPLYGLGVKVKELFGALPDFVMVGAQSM
jgi:hypothetical protein